jgi:cysteine desulfurase
VEPWGAVICRTLARALEKHPARFAAVMGVNNETGAVTDIAALALHLRAREEAGGRPVHLHCDLVQALGKMPLHLAAWGVDSAAFSAHKLGGPRGIGLLYLKKTVTPLCSGGGQERGIRPGTENTSGAVALADSMERRASPAVVQEEMQHAARRMDYLINRLKKIPRCTIIPEQRATALHLCETQLHSSETQLHSNGTEGNPAFSPWILQARFLGIPGEVMVRALDDLGIALSTGAACSSRSRERTVLGAMGLDETAQREGVRISQGWTTTHDDFDVLVEAIETTLKTL